MNRRPKFARNLDAFYYAEIFLVCAVSAVLGIRLFLHMTGYPQIGNSTLHIAHMLWGGLLMLVALIMLFSFIGKRIELWAAILGGAGFGTFIDEVGKFVTSDNDYFFEPSVAIMYVVIVLIILALHMIRSGWTFTRREYLVNALKGLEEAALSDLDEDEKNKVLHYLDRSDPDDPLTPAVRKLIMNVESMPPPSPGLYRRLKDRCGDYYESIAGSTIFRRAIVVLFLSQLTITLGYVVFLTLYYGFGLGSNLSFAALERAKFDVDDLSFVDLARLLSSVLSGVFVFLGVYYMRRSRLKAYMMFERAVLVSILLTYVFVFYKEQFAALTGLFFNLLILIGLRILIRQEQVEEIRTASFWK
jgi:hypothetical protein